MLFYLVVCLVGLMAGIISGVVGTGSSILLLPILVLSFGPKQAVPIMAIAAIMANIAKLIAWWRDIDWQAAFAYAILGIPAAALGAHTLISLPSRIIDIALGIFFIVMIPIRHWIANKHYQVKLWQLALIGGVIGFLTGIVLSTGPLSVPAFTFYGLAKGPFLATEAAGSLALFVSKAITFHELGVLPSAAIFKGLIIGTSLMVGSFIGKEIVLRLSPNFFRILLDGVMFFAGLAMFLAAFTG